MAEVIKVRNVPAQHIGVANSAPCPEMNIVAKEITENGRYEARAEGATGFDPVIVNVPSREEIGYENGYAAGYGKGSTDGYADALAKRTELEVTANGEYIPEGESTGFSKVSVNVPTGAEIEGALISGTLSGAYRNDRVTEVCDYAFYERNNLTSIDLPNVTKLGFGAIRSCKNLTSINVPLFKEPLDKYNDSYIFGTNPELQSISLPSAIELGDYCFYNCKKLTDVYVPKLIMTRYAFSGCEALATLELPSVINIHTQSFANCYSLTTLILRKDRVCNLSATSAFNKCYHILGTVNETYNPEGLKDGYIYVPDDLVEQYKVATNWATYADQLRAIEDYPEITGG